MISLEMTVTKSSKENLALLRWLMPLTLHWEKRVRGHRSPQRTWSYNSRGKSDELYGIMFESYKGFDVFVETIDPKSNDKVNVHVRLIHQFSKHSFSSESATSDRFTES